MNCVFILYPESDPFVEEVFCPLLTAPPFSSVQVTELFVDSKSKLEQCAVDLDEKQQR